MNLEDTIGEVYPAVYYAIAKAYIKLYRFNFAMNTINKGLAILNEETYFSTQYIPMTSIIINETTREGLLISLMDLQEKASSWHCPNAKCFLENCQNNIPYCSPCRDIFFSDPTFSGLITITCSNSSNPCKLNFHPICWKFQKNKLHIENKLSDMDMIGRSCFTSNCGTKDKNVITKIEILNDNAKVVSVIENSSLSMLLVSDSPVNGAIKKHRFIKPIPKLRRPNFLPLRNTQEECIKPFKEISEKEMKLMKLIQLRENNFGIPRENLEADKDMFNNEDINSTNILSECEPENIDSETIQQCRFLSEIMYEFIKVNLIVHKNKLLSKWHETKEIMEYITKTDEYLDSDILNFLLKSPKLIRIGDYICVPQAIQQMFHLFENEITKQYKLILENETNEYKDTTSTDNENILHKECVTNDDSKTNQSPQKLLSLINDVFEDNNVDEDNNIYQNDNTCESSATSLDSCSTNETEINSICKSENEFVLKPNNECFDVNNSKEDDDYEQSIFYKEDKSFNYNNDITDKDNCTNIVYDDTNTSQSSTKNPFLEENMTNNSIKNIFIQDFEQLTNDELLSPPALQDKYKLLAYNYFVTVQNFAKLSKEKTDMEDSFKLKLKEKDSIMKTVIEERKILIDRLNSYESHISEKVSDNYDELNADILKLKSNINRLEQEKKDDECNFKLLIEEKNTIEKILREENAQLLKNVKEYEAEINKKNEELNILQDNDLRWKKSFLQKSLESQYYSNKNMLMNGIDYCNLSLDIINRLNSLIKKYIGMHIIPDYIEWSFTLNQFLKLSSECEAEFLKCISVLKSKTEGQKLDEINMTSINLPKYPNKSLSTIVCNVFMALDKHITEISAQNLSIMLPSSLSLNSLSKLEKFSNNGKIIEKNSNVNLFKTEDKFNKHTENKFQNILKKPDLNEKNNEAVQCHLECIDNNKVGNSTLETNINEHNNQIDGILEDVDNKAKSEIAESKNFPYDITNNELLETCDNNKLESTSISNETDHKLLMEEVDSIEQKNQKTEDITKENNTNIDENNKETSINSTDELMNILRSKYTGISDQSLLESLNDLQKFHKKKSLTDIPLNIIIQDVQKYILLHQINHLCAYVETKENIKNTI
ncbi:probable serine/threonine-protein kinase DDB_G0282963 [Vespa mandarinia]|uniref:probable serine/threonine-protein kinase DDB_G0282963 n=1 Tax=Vespa mandarinia TaxID=7446 RepID=UPI0016102865|nr:probable serine/threonine-protein kinase DDB_G0282963 [Vespa mandarinia]